jgi:hypothetical protein
MPAGHDISGGPGEQIYRCVQADTVRGTTTAAAQPDLSVPLGLGSYVFNAYLIMNSAATTTGSKVSVNLSGTKGIFAAQWRWVTAATTASDDVPDQDHTTAPGGVVSAYTSRTPATTGWGVTTDVDATTDVLYIVEGMLTVTVAGELQFCWAPEAVANQTLKAGSSAIVWKTG